MRRSMTAARSRATMMAAKVKVKPTAQASSGHSMVVAMVGAPVSVMLAGWCRVFHHCTEK